MSETAFKLRTDKFKSMPLTAGGTIVAGAVAKVADTVGVYPVAAVSGDSVGFIYQAEKIVLPKNEGSNTGGAAGAKAYFDAGTAKITAVSSGNTLCGRFTVVAADDDTTAEIDLEGNLAA